MLVFFVCLFASVLIFFCVHLVLKLVNYVFYPGGIASARRAAEYGASAAIIESARLGGTCVNVGCVPKKVMYNTAVHAEYLHDAADYGFDIPSWSFNWGHIKKVFILLALLLQKDC